MAGTNLGKAYVQIIPSSDGISGSITKLLGGESTNAGKSAGKNIAGGILKAIAAAGIGTAIVSTVKSAITEGSALQQSLGGVETLFKESSAKVIANAKMAYKTAGMSANQYMEMTTGFAASLLSSVAGDTDKAADIAQMAMTDMSDNANKFGTDLESVKNAYQGFAKGQYMLLDNLKLGYGGTKTEMERLLADAQKLSGVKYDISNLSDVYSAINVIQKELDVAGTTAKEAATTFSGSLGMMKAAAQNVLGNLMLGENLTPALQGLTDSVIIFVNNNLLPAVQNILKSLPGVLVSLITGIVPTVLPELLNSVIELLNSLISSLPQLATVGIEMVNTLLTGISTALPGLLQSAVQIVVEVASAILNNLPIILSAALSLVEALGTGITTAIPVLLNALPGIIDSVVSFLKNGTPMIIDTVISVLESVFNVLPSVISSLATIIPPLLVGIIETIVALVPTLFEKISSVVSTALPEIFNSIIVMLPELIYSLLEIIVEQLPGIFTAIITAMTTYYGMIFDSVGGIWDGIKELFAPAGEWFSQIFSDIWQSIVDVFSSVGTWVSENIIEPVKKFFSDLWGAIVAKFHMVIDPWIEIIKRAAFIVKTTVIEPIKNFFSGLWDDIVKIFSVVKDWFSKNISEPVTKIFTGIWDKLKTGASNAWQGIKDVFSKISDWFKEAFSKAWQKVKDVFSTGGKIFDGIKEGITSAFKTVVNAIIKAINKVISIPFNAINKMFDKLRAISILGVSPFSWISNFSVPEIPLLAKGGIVDSATLAILGEKGKEAVVPLENNTQWMKTVARNITDYSKAEKAENAPLQLNKLIELLSMLVTSVRNIDDEFISRLYSAVRDLKFEINEREFGRLVREVQYA